MKGIFLLSALFILGCASTVQQKPKEPIHLAIQSDKASIMKKFIKAITNDGFPIIQTDIDLGIISTDFRKLDDDERVQNWLINDVTVLGKLSLSISENDSTCHVTISPLIKYDAPLTGDEQISQIGVEHPFYIKYENIAHFIKSDLEN